MNQLNLVSSLGRFYDPERILTMHWASVTVVLVGLLIYRALIGMREEDQLFLAYPARSILRASNRSCRRAFPP